MEEHSLSSSLNILEKDYDDSIRNKADLDERVFINEEDHLLGLESLSGGAANVTGIKVCFIFEKAYSPLLVFFLCSSHLSNNVFYSVLSRGNLIQ